MCKGKENSFVGEYRGISFETKIDANGIKVEDKSVGINIKIEKVGSGAYSAKITYSDNPTNVIIVLGFKDNNDTIVSSTGNGRGIVYLYFEGSKLRHKISFAENNIREVKVSELKRVTYDCHSHHGNCGCKH